MLKIDFDRIVTNLEGLPIKTDVGQDVTLKYAAVSALLAMHNDGSEQDGKEKRLRYKLARRISEGNFSVSSGDLNKIKTLIGRMFNPLLVGASSELFDELEKEDEKVEKLAAVPGETL